MMQLEIQLDIYAQQVVNLTCKGTIFSNRYYYWMTSATYEVKHSRAAYHQRCDTYTVTERHFLMRLY